MPVLMLLAGLGLAGWNAWQRLGRTPAARAWAGSLQGDWKRRSVLVVRPLLAVVLVLGAVVAWHDDPGGSGGGGLAVALGLAIGLCLALLAAYLVLPIPVPGFVQPRWFREQSRRGPRRGPARAT